MPHYTTIEGFANRPGIEELMQELLDTLIKEINFDATPGDNQTIQAPHQGAMDSTGVQPTCASVYFQRRKFGHAKAPYRAFAKLSVLVLCGVLLPASFVVDWGPNADVRQAETLVRTAAGRVRLSRVYADAGYDSEKLHELCRDELGIASVIAPVVRARDGKLHTKHRASMHPLPPDYGRRWAVETFFSALKRTTGSTLRARGKENPLKELAVRTLAFAVRRV